MNNVEIVFKENKLIIVRCDNKETIDSITIDELAELMEFRYATPWNVSKDIMEKVFYIIGDIREAYEHSENFETLTKEEILDQVKKRKHFK